MNADQQVIDMVNRKHEKKRRNTQQEKIRREKRRRWFVVKLEIMLLTIGLLWTSACANPLATIFCIVGMMLGISAALLWDCAAIDMDDMEDK